MDVSAVQLEAQLNATEEQRAWLTVGIPTVPRKNGADYLTRTLETLLQELPADDTDPLYGRVRVIVMNNQPGNHSVFYAMRFPGDLCCTSGPALWALYLSSILAPLSQSASGRPVYRRGF